MKPFKLVQADFPPYVYACQLVKVIDGDTVDVMIDLGFHITKQERVRLAKIDTPEVYGSNATSLGIEARVFTHHWFNPWGSDGEKHFLHSHKYDEREKYGRVLGDFYRTIDGKPDQVPLSEALRKAGLEKK